MLCHRRPGALSRCRALFGSALLAVTVAVAGCADAGDSLAPAAEPSSALHGSSSTQSGLVECPVYFSRSTSATIGPLGGTLELDGSSITLPVGAVLTSTLFTLTIPASNYMEIGITAGLLEHFDFLKPVSVTISYSRCTRGNIDKRTLTVWHIDPVTKSLLENMNGSDDKSSRTVAFGTGHLSGYSIGYGTEPPPEGGN